VDWMLGSSGRGLLTSSRRGNQLGAVRKATIALLVVAPGCTIMGDVEVRLLLEVLRQRNIKCTIATSAGVLLPPTALDISGRARPTGLSRPGIARPT